MLSLTDHDKAVCREAHAFTLREPHWSRGGPAPVELSVGIAYVWTNGDVTAGTDGHFLWAVETER